MKAERLVEMANDIGNYFKAEPVHEEAVDGVYQHLKKFWEPRMHHQIIVYVNEKGSDELLPIVAEAVQRLKHNKQTAA